VRPRERCGFPAGKDRPRTGRHPVRKEGTRMSKVKVVVDSTADIPRDIAEELGITVVPLNVHFGDEVFLDWVEMSPPEFYEKLTTSPHHPRTSQPAPGDFAKVYEELTGDGSPVLSLHISAALSGTLQSAELGKAMVENKEARVEIIDTRGASMHFGLAAIRAGRAAKEGRSLEEVAALVRETMEKIKVVFAVDTLEYLVRNGRIGRAQGLIGSLLSIKPLLTLEDGLVAPLEKVRGAKKVLPRMVEIMTENLEPDRDTDCCIVHADCLERARELKEMVEKATRVREFIVTDLGPVIGTHAGPGTLGLVYYQP